MSEIHHRLAEIGLWWRKKRFAAYFGRGTHSSRYRKAGADSAVTSVALVSGAKTPIGVHATRWSSDGGARPVAAKA
jgi:hypothetical protein